ncbi:hypothetical protein [Dictyobacter formicarum]|nr:hypothetical protein [Dictyobacter formicarum]
MYWWVHDPQYWADRLQRVEDDDETDVPAVDMVQRLLLDTNLTR